ncbi:hypothetical protein MBLNU459_g1764t2 [Dothideomycetes sp. NU459]
MEQRLQALEAANAGRVSYTPMHTSTPPSVTSRQAATENPRSSVLCSNGDVNVSLRDELSDSRREDIVDSMGTIKPAAEVNAGFFGPSSNIAFMDHIWNAVIATSQQTAGSTRMQSDTDAAILNVSRTYRSPRELDGDALFAFPTDADTQRLFSHYFENTGLLFPYVHEASMYEKYAQSRANGFRDLKLSWLALFNMVLAQGNSTRTDDINTSAERIAASDVFYHRALGLSRLQDMHGANVETVQYLLLMVQYLQSTQRSSHVWTVFGSAVKAAFSIGLHSEMASKNCTPLDREVRKRTWYGCVILDRTLGMTLGRPASIPQHYVRLSLPEPFPPDNASISDRLTTPEVAMLSMQFFTATVQLYKIMWTVLDVLYGQNMGCESDESFSDTICHIIKLDHQLLSWRQNLPSALKTSNSSIPAVDLSTRIPQRLRSILTLRFLNTRLLLHRPVLARLLDNHAAAAAPSATAQDPSETTALRDLARTSTTCALESATQIIGIVHSHGERKAALGAWWFSLYFTFNAALVTLALAVLQSRRSSNNNSTNDAELGDDNYCDSEEQRQRKQKGQATDLLSPSLSPSPSSSQQILLRNSFSLAIQALAVLDRGNPIVERCRRYLTKLLELRLFDDESPSLPPPPPQQQQPHAQPAPPAQQPPSTLLQEWDSGAALLARREQPQQPQQLQQQQPRRDGESEQQQQQQQQPSFPTVADVDAPDDGGFKWDFDGEMAMEMGEYMREGYFELFDDVFGTANGRQHQMM